MIFTWRYLKYLSCNDMNSAYLKTKLENNKLKSKFIVPRAFVDIHIKGIDLVLCTATHYLVQHDNLVYIVHTTHNSLYSAPVLKRDHV